MGREPILEDQQLARQVPAHVPREQARVDVVAAAHAVADLQLDRLCGLRGRMHAGPDQQTGP